MYLAMVQPIERLEGASIPTSSSIYQSIQAARFFGGVIDRGLHVRPVSGTRPWNGLKGAGPQRAGASVNVELTRKEGGPAATVLSSSCSRLRAPIRRMRTPAHRPFGRLAHTSSASFSNMSEERFSEKEVALVLRRAAEIDATGPAITSGMSVADIEAVAAEARHGSAFTSASPTPSGSCTTSSRLSGAGCSAWACRQARIWRLWESW